MKKFINNDGIFKYIVANLIVCKFNVNPVNINHKTNRIEKYVYYMITIVIDKIYKIIKLTNGLSNHFRISPNFE